MLAGTMHCNSSRGRVHLDQGSFFRGPFVAVARHVTSPMNRRKHLELHSKAQHYSNGRARLLTIDPKHLQRPTEGTTPNSTKPP